MEYLTLDGSAHDLQRMAAYFPDTSSLREVGVVGHHLSFENECLHGSALAIDMHFGMRMVVTDFEGHVPLSLDVQHEPTDLEFSFFRGQGSYAVAPSGEKLELGGGTCHLGRLTERTLFRWFADGGATEQSVHISLSSPALLQLLGLREMPERLAVLLKGDSSFAMSCSTMDARMYSITDEILEFAREATTKNSVSGRLFLQAKAMELIAVLCDHFLTTPEVGGSASEDVKRLHRARDILMRSLQQPPTTAELAKRVGMGERRLKNGFREVFGAPVMSYARQMKLERARFLLHDRSHSVTQVAHLTGYANPSKFAAAYRRQFGMSPSAS